MVWMSVINTTSWRCLCTRFCHDYDLCGTCEKRGADVHDPSHVLLKMSVPCNKACLSRACVEGVLRRCITESPRSVSNQNSNICDHTSVLCLQCCEIFRAFGHNFFSQGFQQGRPLIQWTLMSKFIEKSLTKSIASQIRFSQILIAGSLTIK